MTGSLADIHHIVLVLAERGSVTGSGSSDAFRAVADVATQCRAYHVSPSGEDPEHLWRDYGRALSAAGYEVAVGDASALGSIAAGVGHLPDVAVLNVDAAELDTVLAGVLPDARAVPGTLVAVAVALPVTSTTDPATARVPPTAPTLRVAGLGHAGLLVLVSPWTPPGWISEEVFDHTSVMRLCEAWTTARGRAVAAPIPEPRRWLCGDLQRVIELRDASEIGALPRVAGRMLARPVPYFPVVEVHVGDDGVSLTLENRGPVAQSPVPFVVTDGVKQHEVVVDAFPRLGEAGSDPTASASIPDGMRTPDDMRIPDDMRFPVSVRIPITIVNGAYDVTVSGPNHFHRRFAGSFPDLGVHCEAEYVGRDPWFPSLTVSVWHDRNMPIFFWMQKRLGERAASKAAGYGSGTVERLPGPRQTARFREEPGANTFGWYDVAVTTSADPAWIREYAGQMPTGMRTTLAY